MTHNTSNDVTCDCGRRMVVRTARRGANAGSQFYGCSSYPKCERTRPYHGPALSAVAESKQKALVYKQEKEREARLAQLVREEQHALFTRYCNRCNGKFEYGWDSLLPACCPTCDMAYAGAVKLGLLGLSLALALNAQAGAEGLAQLGYVLAPVADCERRARAKAGWQGLGAIGAVFASIPEMAFTIDINDAAFRRFSQLEIDR